MILYERVVCHEDEEHLFVADSYNNTTLLQVQVRANNNSRGHDEYSRVCYRNLLSAIKADSGAWLSAGMSPKLFI